MSDGPVFSRLIDEYGNSRKDTQKERIPGLAKNAHKPLQYKPESAEDVLMQLEERNVGAVPWEVYKKYLRFAGGLVWAPVILVLLILAQGSQGWGFFFTRFSL
jgi:ATP-binding cassette, subfamily C (CFTR/MRP), member 1